MVFIILLLKRSPHAGADLILSSLHFIRVVDSILPHFFVILFSLCQSLNIVRLPLLFRHLLPEIRSKFRQLLPLTNTILICDVFGLLLVVDEKARDWSLGSMRILFSLLYFHLSHTDPLQFTVKEPLIQLFRPLVKILESSFLLSNFGHCFSLLLLELFNLICMLFYVLPHLFDIFGLGFVGLLEIGPSLFCSHCLPCFRSNLRYFGAIDITRFGT